MTNIYVDGHVECISLIRTIDDHCDESMVCFNYVPQTRTDTHARAHDILTRMFLMP
jgi:hypothetical protein